jgi:hypothetical protein
MGPDHLLAWLPLQWRRYFANLAAPPHPHLKAAQWRAAPVAALLALAACSTMPVDVATEPAAPPNYGLLVSNTLKGYKGFSGYSNFEISDLRWVHALTGWNWLTCVRYDDHGRQHAYALFIKDNAVVNGRYATAPDLCGTQQYRPFDIATGTIGGSDVQQPIY